MATSRQNKSFTAYVYKNDYEAMQKLVQQYPNIETGGDLFGLWQDENTVVIQLFIGPGEKCQRTKTSFHQDVQYLGRIGTVITKEEGLCNVGEWHSHHQIGMPQPSRQDNQTVLSNMPQLGLDRFVLFIGNIKPSSAGKRSHEVPALKNIEINCFVYREGVPHSQQPVKGEIVFMGETNPLQQHNKAQSKIKEGAEPAFIRQEKEGAKDKKPRGGDDRKKSDYGSGRAENLQSDENRSPNSNLAGARSKEPENTKPSQKSSNVGGINAGGFF